MIDPGSYYRPDEYPDERETRTMWRNISGRLRSGHQRQLSIDRRSFILGIAAAVILMLASVGLYTTVNNAIQTTLPESVKVDKAYEDAIGAFERIAVKEGNPGESGNGHVGLVQSRAEQLQSLESAIRALRSETGPRDVSPMIRSALRDLYAKKLALLQTMVEQGEIEL